MLKSKNLFKSITAVSAIAVLSFSTVSFAGAANINPYDVTTINADLNATVKPDHVTLTWSADPTTTQTITWRTNTKVNAGQVKYKKVGDSTYQTSAVSKATLFTTDINDKSKGTMNLYSVTLKGLTPGTKYTYMVGNGSNWSEEATFSTEAKNVSNFKFMIFGDSQSGNSADPNYGPWHDTVNKAFSSNKDAKFFINMGDLVEIGHYYNHWNNWFAADKDVISTIPAMPVQGNHETYVEDKNWSTAKPGYYTTQFNVFQNGPQGLKGQTYSYNYGNAHFVVLDSQEGEETVLAKGPDILKPQQEWLEKDLAANKNAKFTLVFFHKTPYYNKTARANEVIEKAFCPIFDKYHVDVVFNGHDHALSRTYPIKNDEFVSSPAEGTVYYVTGRSGNKYYNDLVSKVWDASFYDPQDMPCYETVSVNGGELTINAYKQDGTQLDSYVINKDNPSKSTKTILPGKYNKARLVVNGIPVTLGSILTIGKEDGKAYINLQSLCGLLTGNSATFDDKALTLKMTDDDDNVHTYKFEKADFNKDGLINMDALNKKAEFNNKFDTQFNMVKVEWQ